jgi:hypothetical protein
MQLASLLEQNEFAPETARVLTQAFDETWEIIEAAGGPLVNRNRAPATRALIARHIVDMAIQGERDMDRLIDSALDCLSGAK